MIRELLGSIAGVEIWPIIGMFIFIASFIAMLVWVIRLDKKYVKHMKDLPLEPDENVNNGD
ncbi:MAG: cbb3-type cytochrome c oxidase subunit 3 [Calditrichia bacterium]